MSLPFDADFVIREHVAAQAHVIELGGALDFAAVAPLEHRLGSTLDRGVRTLVVDLTGVTLLTSTVINVLFAAVRRVRYSGGAVALVCSDAHTKKLLALTGLDRVAPVHGSLGEAAAAAADASD